MHGLLNVLTVHPEKAEIDVDCFCFFFLSLLLLTVFYHAVNYISVGAHCCDSVLRLHRQGKSDSSFFFPLQQNFMPLFPINKS